MPNSIVILRAAIVSAAEILSEEDELTLSLEPDESSDTLVLSFNNSSLPFNTPLQETLVATLVMLGENLAEGLEGAAEDKRESFKESFQEELREIQEMTETDDVSEWEGILNDIINAAQAIKRRMNEEEINEADKLDEAAEDLRSAIEDFRSSQTPIALVS